MHQSAPRHALIPLKRVCTLVMALCLMTMIGSRSTLLAQDTAPTAEATSEPILATEEAPLSTEPPVYLATEEAPLPTADAPLPTEDAPVPTAEVTLEPIAAATSEATSAPLTSFADSFTDWTGAGWDIVDWSVKTETDGSAYLTAVGGTASAAIQNFRPMDFQLTTRLRISENNVAEILVRSELENYRVVISSLGATRLLRGETLLAASDTAPLPLPTAENPNAQWFNLSITAAGGTIGVSVNDVPQIAYTDPAPLAAGMIVFKPFVSNVGEIALDDVSVVTIDPLTTVVLTPAAPPASPFVPEATLEATVEATAEATADATLEATAEATLEATLEATAEATVEAPGLTAEEEAKLPEAIRGAFAFYALGDLTSTTALLAEQLIYPDENNRIYLVVMHDGSQDIAGLISAGGGEIVVSNANDLKAYIPLHVVLTLLETPAVTNIYLPPRATSTGPVVTGNGAGGRSQYLESFDPLGATDWHDANVLGAGIRIAVIDTGFALSSPTVNPPTNPPTTGDFVCLKQSTPRSGQPGQPNNNHGRNVIEVLCDIAPGALVYTYQAVDDDTLVDAMNQARADGSDIILITLDLGASASPGDGSGVTGTSADPYVQIQLAHDEGIAVIVAAGNNGNNGVNGVIPTNTARYLAYNHTGTATSFKVTVPEGSGNYVHVAYQSASWNSDSALNVTLTGVSVDPLTANKAGRRFGPINCTNPSGCEHDLNISGPGTRVVQVQVAGGGTLNFIPGFLKPATTLNDAGNLGRPADSPYAITVGAVCADYTQNYPIYPYSSRGPVYGGNGAAPAALPPSLGTNALTRDQTKPDVVSFSNVRTSLGAPIFDSAFGELNPTCAGGFAGTSAAAAHVAGMVALMLSVSPDVNPSMTANTDTSFNRTQFANASDAVQNIRDYLQSHTVEMPFGTGPSTGNSVEKPDETGAVGTLVGANGFDMVYGAGLSVLGSPFYDLTQAVNYDIDPDQPPTSTTLDGDACNAIYFVGQGNPGSSTMDGTIANPFLHIAYAYNRAAANDCIVVMPGEYVTPLLLQSYNINSATALGRSIYSYDDVMAADYGPSIFWMNTQYYNRRTISTPNGNLFVSGYYGTAQIMAETMIASSNRTVVSGFTFLATHMLGTVNANANSSNVYISEPQAVLVYNAKDITIANSSLGEETLPFFYGEQASVNVTFPGISYDADPAVNKAPLTGYSSTMIVALNNSDGLIVDNNRFVKNQTGIAGGSRPTILFVDQSGDGSGTGYETDRVRFSRNLVQGNVNIRDGSNASWSALLKANLSAIDITSNTFVQNSAETLISTATASEDNTLETRILGNIFLSNTIATPVGEGDSGPLINLYYVRNLYFINNTVVKNTATSNKYGAILLRGLPIPALLNSGSITTASHQLWEIQNNIIYSNTLGRGLADDSLRTKPGQAGTAYECDTISGVNNAGAKKNWVFGNGLDNSACGGALNLIANSNRTNVDPSPFFLGSNLTLALDAIANPVYYALNNLCPSAGNAACTAAGNFDGVDVGETTFVPSIINSDDFKRDVDGGARLVDTIDIGAFEFETLKFVDGLPASVFAGAFPEDKVAVVSLDNLSYLGNPIVSGGSGALSFEIIVGPEDYGTHCVGGTFTEANKGVQVIGKVLKYCPPRNFYTDPENLSGSPDISATGGFWQDKITLEFRVRDASGQRTLDSRILEIDISQDNDAALTGTYNYVVTSSRVRVPVQLRPYVTFTPAGAPISAFNVPFAPKFGNDLAVDFPYSYSAPDLINETGDEELFDQADLNTAFSELQATFNTTGRSGLIYIDVELQLTGYKKFSYTVTDRNGSSATYTVTVRVASTIPSDGLYDDASFAFVYDDAVLNDGSDTNITMGRWETTGAGNAINNTLHRTTTLDDQFIVEYKGTGFVLYMRSAGTASSDFDVDILQGDTLLTMSNWTNVVSVPAVAAPGLRQSTITGGGTCYTRAGIGLFSGAVDNPKYLNGNVLGGTNYTITCEGMPVSTNTYTVRVKNKTAGRFLTVDAISILNPGGVTGTVLTPGYYDVDAKLVRDLFTGWTPITSQAVTVPPTLPKYSNLIAMEHRGAMPNLTFKLRRATGFAIETVLESTPPLTPFYEICVKDLDFPAESNCQKYTNRPVATQAFVTNVFRPFYGLNDSQTYEVTVRLLGAMPAGARMVIDSITVFGDNVQTSGPMPLSNIDDISLDWFVLGGGREDSWAFSGAAITSLNSTLTTSSLSGTGRYVGPFVAFQMPAAADAFILKYTFAPTLSTNWMICVDRALHDTPYGNCLRVNPVAAATLPTYDRINQADGLFEAADAADTVMAVGPVSNQPLQGTLIIREAMFDTDWSTANHVVEIFSLTEAPLNFDVITPLDTSNSLQPGYYEEITPGLRYFHTNNTIESTKFDKLATAPWTLLTLPNYSGSGALQTRQQNASVAFNIKNATGFAPRLQLSTSTDMLKVCWKTGEPTIDTARVNDVLATGQCRFVDTEATVPLYKVDRPFFGFNPTLSYTIVVQAIGDTFTPAPRVAPITLIWDGVTILGSNYDPASLQTLTPNTVTEFSFKNRVADKKFLYFGTGWSTRESTAGAGRSASNFDLGLGLGSSVLFKVDGNAQDALVFLRDTSTTFSDWEVCATEADYGGTRTCAVIETNTAAGFKVPAIFYLPGSEAYIISITSLNNGYIGLDTVQHVPVALIALPTGRYEDTDPRLRYDQNATNLVLNSDMEAATLVGWTTEGSVTATLQAALRYSGLRSIRLNAITANSGVKSAPFSLQANTPYTVVGRVQVNAKFGAAQVRMQMYAGGVAFGPIATLDIGTTNTALPVNVWHPLRLEYNGIARTNVEVRITITEAAPTATTYVYVDDVSVTQGSAWHVFPSAAFSGGFLTRSASHGAQMSFTFTGTGFNLGTVADTLGGKIEICYGAGATLPVSPTCMTYLNEATAASRTLTRGVLGLTPGTYTVRVRDVEEGYLDTALATTNFITRGASVKVGRIGIDFVEVFDTVLPPAISSSAAINDNAVDGNGDRYIQLLPGNRWRTFEGALAPNRSGATVAAQVDPFTSNVVATDGGTAELFRIAIPAASEANIIVHTGFGSGYSTTFLACVNATSGNLDYDNVLRRQISSNPANCTVVTTTPNLPFFVLNKSLITELGTVGTKTVTLRTLTPGFFFIDGLTVLYGNNLITGYYENSQTAAATDLMQGTTPANWTAEVNALHSGGYALVTTDPTQILTLKLVNSTGLTIFTASGPQNKGIEITVDDDASTNVYTRTVTLPAVAGYKVPVTLAGLPESDYTVTIKLPAAVIAPAKLMVDAVEVYGTLQALGSLYDDASIAPNGVPYLTYTPNTNAAWAFVKGAAGHLDLTYHQTTRAEAGVAFQVLGAQGLILHYGATTNTSIRVCVTEIAGGAQTCSADIPLNSKFGKSRQIRFTDTTMFPVTPAGDDFNVSIVNALASRVFTLDAIQVIETGAPLAEGIYDALFLKSVTLPTPILNGTWTTPTIASNSVSGSPGAFVEFTFKGIGFSLVLKEDLAAASATASSYTLCVKPENGTGCTTPVAVNQNAATITRGAFTADFALTAAGLHLNTSDKEGTYRVRVTHTGTGNLFVRSLHILGARPNVMLDKDDGRVENNDPRLRYLPFGSLVDTVPKDVPPASGLTQHQGALRGAGVYFEFTGGGFEYGRQTAAAFGGYNYCYAPINNTAAPSFACQPSTAGVNTAAIGMQRVATINTGATCNTAAGCWVRLYSTDNRLLPLDFIRILGSNVTPLTAGTYEESNPAFSHVRYDAPLDQFFLNEPTLQTTSVPDVLASGGAVRQYRVSTAPSTVIDPNTTALFGGMVFGFHGTGFSVNFARNAFADAVQICYATGLTLPLSGADVQQIVNGDCSEYDNYSGTPVYNQMRTVQGLPEADYAVFVRMMGDNYRVPNSLTPQTHVGITQTPIQMLIDNVTIYNDPWFSISNPANSWESPTDPALEVLMPGQVYETSYLNRVAQNRFWYTGPWSTVAVTGGYVDAVSRAGSSLHFRTSGASGMTVYVTPSTDTAIITGPIQVCAHPIDVTGTPITLQSGEKSHCETLQTRVPGSRYPLPVRFVEGDNNEYSVSIVTLENTLVQIDAIELFNVTSPMQPGVYESTSPFIRYSEFTPLENELPNGSFASTCDPWIKDTPSVGKGLTAVLTTIFVDGTGSCLVSTNEVDKGIQSPNFNLQSGNYILVARVYVVPTVNPPNTPAPVVRMKTTTPVGITTQTFAPTASQIGKWYTLRQEFVVTDTSSVALRFENASLTGTHRFAIDGLWLIPKGRGQWNMINNKDYSGTTAMRSQTPGAQASFTFTGTGFAVRMPTDASSGEVEICYGISPATDKCFIYQQDSVTASYDVSRVVAGLPLGTYSVLISEKDDGLSGTAATETPRIPAGITIDSVTIFGAEGTPADITQIGQYEQDAKNSSGTPYLAKVPSSNWRDFAGTTWTGGTASQVTTTSGVLTFANAGATAVMSLSNAINNPTVIVYNRVTTNQSATLLVCASSDSSRANLRPDFVGGVDWVGTSFQLLPTSVNKCILHNLRAGNQIILTSSQLTALGSANQFKLITFTTLTPGGFNLDAFEVTSGGALPAGIHDEIKPDTLLNFNNSAGVGTIGTTPACNPRLGWCTSRVPTYYGGSTAYTRQRGARLNFSFQGTGFSVISSVNLAGADMRVCLAPSTASEAFPNDNNLYYGNPPGLTETWCDVVTTKFSTVEWPAKNPDRVLPEAAVNQYGFAYYGLQANTYQVEIRLIDGVMALSDSLIVDAIAIFGNDPAVLEADGRTSNFFDDRQSQIVYEPAVNWSAVTSTTQPPFFKTEMRAGKAGSIVRLRVEGNAITIYQSMRVDTPATFNEFGQLVTPFIPGNTRNLRVCLMVGDGPIPCEPEAMEIGERATARYRQNMFTAAGIPILIYGLGPGEHNVIIENRDMRTISIDAFRVHPE